MNGEDVWVWLWTTLSFNLDTKLDLIGDGLEFEISTIWEGSFRVLEKYLLCEEEEGGERDREDRWEGGCMGGLLSEGCCW